MGQQVPEAQGAWPHTYVPGWGQLCAGSGPVGKAVGRLPSETHGPSSTQGWQVPAAAWEDLLAVSRCGCQVRGKLSPKPARPVLSSLALLRAAHPNVQP